MQGKKKTEEPRAGPRLTSWFLCFKLENKNLLTPPSTWEWEWYAATIVGNSKYSKVRPLDKKVEVCVRWPGKGTAGAGTLSSGRSGTEVYVLNDLKYGEDYVLLDYSHRPKKKPVKKRKNSSGGTEDPKKGKSSKG
jgi:hypothetical protein